MCSFKEEIFFFEGSAKRRLLGFLHTPLSFNRNTGIIYCHPFAEEKNMSHAVVVQTSRALAQNGFTVFRFDMSGCGDSEGELDEVTIADWQKDLDLAVKFLQKETTITNLGLWGLRTGCGLSLLYAAHHADVLFLILWQPVVDFQSFINQFLRWKISSQITTGGNEKLSISNIIQRINDQGVAHIIGYPLSRNLYESFCKVGKNPSRFIPECPALILSLSLMERPSFPLKRYYAFLHSSNASVCFHHLTAEPFWDHYWRYQCNEATNDTLKWVNNLQL